MLYIFIIFIALSLGGIVFLGFRRLGLKELSAMVGGILHRKAITKDIKDNISMESEEYWIEKIKNEPDNASHYKMLGEWYMYNNKASYAIKTLEYATILDSKDKKILKHLNNLKRERA